MKELKMKWENRTDKDIKGQRVMSQLRQKSENYLENNQRALDTSK